MIDYRALLETQFTRHFRVIENCQRYVRVIDYKNTAL